MTKCRPHGLRRATALVAALAFGGMFSVSSALATPASLSVSATPPDSPTQFTDPIWMRALVVGFGQGAPTGKVLFDFAEGTASVDVPVTTPGAGNPIASGLAHTCALTASAGVKCWGDGQQGQLGDGTSQNHTEPLDVVGVSGAIAVAAASQHSCALLNTGGVMCWGTGYGPNAVAVPSITNARQITANGGHTCVLTTAGGVKCWGLNSSGQLGDGSTDPGNVPVDVVGLASGAGYVTAGYSHTCAIANSGKVLCWGSNEYGQLGGGDAIGASSTTPVIVDDPDADAYVYIAAGERHTCGYNAGPSLKCWGDNTHRQLGTINPFDGSHNKPVLAAIGNLEKTRGLYAGGSHTCIVRDDGKVQCWGYNDNGQLGDGRTVTMGLLPLLTLDGTASVVAPGGLHTCVLMQAGQRKCWGDNSAGQYGNSLSVSVSSPLDIPNLTIPVFGMAFLKTVLHAGTHAVTAGYHDGNYDSVSAQLSRTVLPMAATLTLASAPNPSLPGQSAVFTAKLNSTNAWVSVQLWEGSELLGTSRVNSNSAQFLLKLPPGIHDITAVATYEGGDYTAPTPAIFRHTVLQANTKTTLKADPPAVALGKPVTLVATVAVVLGNYGPITGSVTFKHNGTTLRTVALVNGVARLNAGTWPLGANSFTASYSGSTTFAPSDGAAIALVDPTVGMPAEASVNIGALRGSVTSPAATRLSNGRFVVLTSLHTSPTINSGTYFQIYRPDGLPVGPFTGVVPTLIGQNEPSIGAAGNGFVIVFTFRPVGKPAQIWGMRISALGALLGHEFKINTTDQGHIQAQQVAGLKDGGFVVVWSAGPDKGGSGEIYAQRYDSNARKVGGEFVVNTTLQKTQAFPAVAALANGGFVVAWSSDANDGNSDIRGQRYAANGAKAGPEIKITNVAGKPENAPSIAAFHSGGFVVAWTGDPGATVYGRRFTAAGLPSGAAFVVGQSNYGWWEPLALTVLDDDRFLIGYSKSGNDIYARLFGLTAAFGSEFRVNAPLPALTQRLRPTAVALSNRNIFVAWEYYAGARAQVRMRRLDLPPVP